jgi:gamma-glutamylcyclotransferase (GGCT)/AIG2-like uncharacterized protein YtfP
MTTAIHTTAGRGGSRNRPVPTTLTFWNVRPNLFVYGTLCRGGRYHPQYIPAGVAVQPARTRGRLYHLPAGYPALAISESLILASGTADEYRDCAYELHWRSVLPGTADLPAHADADWVHGELITLPDHNCLRTVDELEEYRPGGPSLFLRALAPVWTDEDSTPVPAWVYVQSEPRGTYLPAGRWSE